MRTKYFFHVKTQISIINKDEKAIEVRVIRLQQWEFLGKTVGIR